MRQAAITRAVPAATGRRPVAAPVQGNVPAAAKTRVPKPRQMFGWTVDLTGQHGVDTVAIDPLTRQIAFHPVTYAWVKNDTAAIQFLGSEKAEAVRLMHVRMADVSSYAPTKVADPKRKPKAPLQDAGIKALAHEATLLVQDLARLDSANLTAVSDVAGRYGRLRDQMAELRAAFTAAEGSFELAQELLIEKMGIE